MKNANRTKNMIAAGTFTGLLLAVFLAFGGRGTAVVAGNNDPGGQTNIPGLVSPNSNAADPEDLEGQVTSLTNTLEQMQQREADYRAQIELANETINDLQNSQTSYEEYEDEDEEDHEEHGHEEEHEWYEDD